MRRKSSVSVTSPSVGRLLAAALDDATVRPVGKPPLLERLIALGYGLTYDAIVRGFAPYEALIDELLDSPAYGEHYVSVALTVFASLLGVVTVGTLSGSLLPFVLRRLGFDPASASAPFVATLVDVTGLLIYFSVAAALLRG